MSCSSRWHAESLLFFKTARRVLLWLAVCLAVAMGVGGAALADTAESAGSGSSSGSNGGPQLAGSRLQGEATLRFWGLRVYTARLWALPGFRAEQAASEAVMLELQYLMDLKGRAIAERSLQEMQRAGGFTEAQGQRWLAQMQALFPDVKSGDKLTGIHEPGQGARFWLNGKPLGRVDDPAFANLFFGIWLAPTTSEPAMRLALLGQGSGGK